MDPEGISIGFETSHSNWTWAETMKKQDVRLAVNGGYRILC